jgi:hypothetical protein
LPRHLCAVLPIAMHLVSLRGVAVGLRISRSTAGVHLWKFDAMSLQQFQVCVLVGDGHCAHL